MANDLEEKRNQLRDVRQSLDALNVALTNANQDYSNIPTSENALKIQELENFIQEKESIIQQLTMELSFDEREESFNLENVGEIEEIDQTTSLKPNIPSSDSSDSGRALGKGKELARENITNEAPSRNIDYIEKNTPSVENNDSNEIEKDNSIEPEI